MYELSREMFRSLRPGLLPDPRNPSRPARTLLEVCEDAVRRIAGSPSARRMHAVRLFGQIRTLFAPSRQLELIGRTEAAVEDVYRRLVEHSEGRVGGLLRCAATTRRNHPCMREPIPGLRYCPSHRHLEHASEGAEVPLTAASGA